MRNTCKQCLGYKSPYWLDKHFPMCDPAARRLLQPGNNYTFHSPRCAIEVAGTSCAGLKYKRPDPYIFGCCRTTLDFIDMACYSIPQRLYERLCAMGPARQVHLGILYRSAPTKAMRTAVVAVAMAAVIDFLTLVGWLSRTQIGRAHV